MNRFVVLRCFVGVVVILVTADCWTVGGCSDLVKSTQYHLDTYKNTCYMFVNHEMYWGDAAQYCLDMGGDLVAITREDIQEFLNKKLRSRELGWRNNGVWIGARYYEDMGWIWTTGEKVQYSNWARGQPGKFLNFISFENCAAMKRGDGWKWHDFHCKLLKFHYKFICQFAIREKSSPAISTASVTTTSASKYLAADAIDTHKLSPGIDTEINDTHKLSPGIDTEVNDKHKLSPGIKSDVNRMYKPSGGVGPDVKDIQNLISGVDSAAVELHTLSPGVYLYVVKGNQIKHSLLQVLQGQSVAQTGARDNGNTLILVVVISLAVLLIIVMLIIFFIYRRRQHVKHARDVPAVRFDNLAYSQVQAGQQNMENASRSRPNSNIYLTPSEVNAPYTEPRQIYHSNGVYGKEGLVRSDPLPPLPTASSSGSVSGEEQGACGGSDSLVSEPLISPDRRMDGKFKPADSNRLSNAYVDMSSLNKADDSKLETASDSTLDTTSVKEKEQAMIEPLYSNIASSQEKVESPYEVLP